MARSSVEPVAVARLRYKVRALYLAQSSVTDDASFGRLFASASEPDGVTGKAIRNWFFGEGSRGPDMVPGERFERFVEIFRARLPFGRTAAEARALLLAPSEQDLVLAFFAGAAPVDWITLVLAAPAGAATVVRAGRPGFLEATTRRRVFEMLHGEVDVPVGDFFRLEIAPRPGWLTLLQWGADGWRGLELDDDVLSLEHDGATLLAPLSRPYFQEALVGPRRYLILHTGRPLAPDLAAMLRTSVRADVSLDARALERFAHLAGNPVDFHMAALDVNFYDPGAAGELAP